MIIVIGLVLVLFFISSAYSVSADIAANTANIKLEDDESKANPQLLQPILPVDTSKYESSVTERNAPPSAPSLDKIKEKTNAFSTKEIVLPDWANNIINFVFDFDEAEKFTLQRAIIILSLWIMLVILIYRTVVLFPVIGQGAILYFEAIIISLLISISGGLNSIYQFFFRLLNAIKFLQEWALLRTVFAFLILLVFFLGFLKVTKMVKNKENIITREDQGEGLGLNTRSLR